MQLAHMTWEEVDARLLRGVSIMLPMGSTEQHGPMGLIGTDAICATRIADAAADVCDALVAPTLAYTPAPFNTAFPGTVSISEALFHDLLFQICSGLLEQGFKGVFLVNGHGANLAPAKAVASALPPGAIHVQSWWDPAPVTALRDSMFGTWEGMHATPSEVSITQVFHGSKPAGVAASPPSRLTPEYIAAHSGDRHGLPLQHRAQFPDGRVGSHSALASPAQGAALLKAASDALARDFSAFSAERRELSTVANDP